MDHILTTTHHPASNGIVERFHRQLKPPICCHRTKDWLSVLPIVVLGIRSDHKQNIDATPGELVYGETLRLPAQFFSQYKSDASENDFVKRRRGHTRKMIVKPTAHHKGSPTKTFRPQDLGVCTHNIVRKDLNKKVLDSPYEGPSKIVGRENDQHRESETCFPTWRTRRQKQWRNHHLSQNTSLGNCATWRNTSGQIVHQQVLAVWPCQKPIS